MVDGKADEVLATGADTLLGGDLGCLLNIAGRLHRGAPTRVRHVAEVLAGATEEAPPIGSARSDRRAPKQWPRKNVGGEETCNRRRVFPDNVHQALRDANLQAALGRFNLAFPVKRKLAIERLEGFEALRDAGKAIKDHTLDHLDFYLEQFETKVTQAGGHVHWCADARPPARRFSISVANTARVRSPRASR